MKTMREVALHLVTKHGGGQQAMEATRNTIRRLSQEKSPPRDTLIGLREVLAELIKLCN